MPSNTSPRFFLGDFRIRLPAHNGSHEQTVQWLAAAHTRAEKTLRGDRDFDGAAFRRQMERHIRRFGPSPQAVGFRRSDVGEFLDERFEEKEIFPLHRRPEGVPMGARMHAFAGFATRAVDGLYTAEDTAPQELLHVTCTGYAAPSAVQALAMRRGWGAFTRITHVYHMGCLASLPALRIAAGYLASGLRTARCDVVHTEVCTLHLNPARHDPEQLVVQSLFADGYARYSLHRLPSAEDGFTLLGFLERLLPDSLGDIGWIPGDFGMRMSLSRQVPDRLAEALDPFLSGLAEACGVARAALRDAVYAVHPGGPRILEKTAEWLRLQPWQLAASRQVLFERGNMSSATLPHIWDRLLSDNEVPPGGLVVSLAFGPGLTLYGMLMRRRRSAP